MQQQSTPISSHSKHQSTVHESTEHGEPLLGTSSNYRPRSIRQRKRNIIEGCGMLF